MRLNEIQLEPIVRAALLEDLGAAGDITTQAVTSPDQQTHATFTPREPGVLCGTAPARLAFTLLNPALRWHPLKQDGDTFAAFEPLATIAGTAADILTAERVALNFLTHLSGIASLTAQMVALARETNPRVKVCCSRKTTPNLRVLEKYAVHCGGGQNHRFTLSDGVLIKDNHIVLAPSLEEAIARAKTATGHLMKIEVEADDLSQIEPIIAAGADAILLDNMSAAQLIEAVRLINGRVLSETSGGVSLANIGALAASGVDMISSGSLTHSAPHLDIGLDIGETQ